MYSKTFVALLSVCLIACTANSSTQQDDSGIVKPIVTGNTNPYAYIVAIPLPQGYQRTKADSNSFASWLRNVELKKDKTVYLFNGDIKGNQAAQFAVVNISTGNKNLQQCADAVMRLRAEYLFSTAQFSSILFTDNEGGTYPFTAPYHHGHLQTYLQTVFGMCGSASLSKQLKPTGLNKIEPGDVLIRGGFPGHAVIVMDVAMNKAGKKIYLLAQSYMPAQDIHVLINPLDEELSPWYAVTEEEKIYTPEYVFTRKELKSW